MNKIRSQPNAPVILWPPILVAFTFDSNTLHIGKLLTVRTKAKRRKRCNKKEKSNKKPENYIIRKLGIERYQRTKSKISGW
jgi:hypothetical protein